MSFEREYRWYRTGCERLGSEPAEILSEVEFVARWQEWEAHAERLKAAEADGKLAELDATERAEKGRRIQDDPFVRAVLVGMSEAN